MKHLFRSLRKEPSWSFRWESAEKVGADRDPFTTPVPGSAGPAVDEVAAYLCVKTGDPARAHAG